MEVTMRAPSLSAVVMRVSASAKPEACEHGLRQPSPANGESGKRWSSRSRSGNRRARRLFRRRRSLDRETERTLLGKAGGDDRTKTPRRFS